MTVHYVSNNPKNHHWVILAKSSSDEYIGKLCAITSFVRFVSSVTSTTWEKSGYFHLFVWFQFNGKISTFRQYISPTFAPFSI